MGEVTKGHDSFFVRGLAGAHRAGHGVYNSEYVVFTPYQILPLYQVDYVLESELGRSAQGTVGVKLFDGSMHVLIDREVSVPMKRSRDVHTALDDQTCMRLEIFEGEKKMA